MNELWFLKPLEGESGERVEVDLVVDAAGHALAATAASPTARHARASGVQPPSRSRRLGVADEEDRPAGGGGARATAAATAASAAAKSIGKGSSVHLASGRSA